MATILFFKSKQEILELISRPDSVCGDSNRVMVQVHENWKSSKSKIDKSIKTCIKLLKKKCL